MRRRTGVADRDRGVEVAQRDREAAIQDALLELSETDRELLILRYWLDRSYAEIGEVLAIQEAVVRSRLFEARRRLGRRLKARGVAEA